MVRRFRAAGLFLLIWASVHTVISAAAPEEAAQKEKDAQIFADRMRSLSGSLEHLPTPPKLDQTVQLPILDLKPRQAPVQKKPKRS